MLTRIKKAALLIAVMGALSGCATPPASGAMKMDPSMCKKMMEQGQYSCCKKSNDMRTSGMTLGGQPMQCKP